MKIQTTTPPSRNSTAFCPEASRPTVYIVEDDTDLRDVLAWTLTSAGHRVLACGTGARALELISPNSCGCAVIDLSLPDMNGLELRAKLLENRCRQPFIVLTGTQDVSLAVRSLQSGAIDFLQKPFDRNRLLERIEQAVNRDHFQRRIDEAVNTLTDREREVLLLMNNGASTKEIARQLLISPRTVDVHRHNILKKMGAQSLPRLIRMLNRDRPFTSQD